MRPDNLQVVLRPRSAWEAVELGTALVRQHAGAVWRPWLALSVPVFGLLNALFWWLDQIWLAGVVLWWWLPVFDRIPLYVLSRAVFGHTPGLMHSLRALPDWRRGRLVAHLLWRRLSPWRALGLPVDLLEDGSPADKRMRRRQIVRGQPGVGLLLAGLCVQFVLVLVLAVVLGALVFIPFEFIAESSLRLWLEDLFRAPPRWAQVALNALLWLGLSVIEPFHIGAGFGLYLNRRVRLEAWDIELALRRMRARLGHGGAALLLAGGLLLPGLALPGPVRAQDIPATADAQAQVDDDNERLTLSDVFKTGPLADPHAFVDAVDVAGQDPLLNQRQIQQRWIRKTEIDDLPPPDRERLTWDQISDALARLSEGILWLLALAAAVFLALSARRWGPWMRRGSTRLKPDDTPIQITTLPLPATLPPDLLTHARGLWQARKRRQALALLYRGSLAAVAEHTNTQLPASATEAQCLLLSQHLPGPQQQAAFVQLVTVWQRAAYAGHWPSDLEFEALGEELAQCFRWPR